MNKIILSTDSACDLDDKLKARYGVNCYPYHVIIGEKEYQDGVDLSLEEIYAAYWQQHLLPRTAAINPQEFSNYFKPWTDQGYEVIHFNLSSEISSSYRNCCAAAHELKGVYPIDSQNLSTGMGLLIIEAAERIAGGMSAADIQQEVKALRSKVQVSFILDTLTFMHAGGRCSGIAALGANLLKIKPCIEVDNTSGKMHVGQKYRGTLDKVLKKYTADTLKGRTDLKLDRIFITHTGIDPELISLVEKTIRELTAFKEVLVTRAGCTISSHSGPNTLGLLYMTN